MSGESSLEQLLTEQYTAQQEAKAGPAPAATSTAVALPFSNDALVQLLLERPGLTHQQYGAAFGRGSGWFASVLASESFQRALSPVRHLIPDPSISATLDERFKSLAMQGLSVLQTRLDSKECADMTVLKAVELGLKASGLGAIAAPPAVEAPVGPEAVANRILEAMASAKQRTSNAQAVDIVAREVPPAPAPEVPSGS
jgi:hypothetical protein